MTQERFNTQRLRAISITEVARRLGCDLRRKGARQVALCPWHDDRHPSLTLYEDNHENHCYCFSCGKGGGVIDFTMQHEGWTFQEACRWLSTEFGIPINGKQSHQSRSLPMRSRRSRLKPPEPHYTFIPMEMVEEMASHDSSLCRCLKQLFIPRHVEWLSEEYMLGTYALGDYDDYTVFPDIDRRGRVCNLKIQHFDSDIQSPRFAHRDEGGCYWLGTMLAGKGRLPRDAKFSSRCLFGEHLLPRRPDATVALVESPKNALFGALHSPRLTWVATGSKNSIGEEVLEPLRGRNVIVLPDRDAIPLWTEKLRGMTHLANFVVSDFCERMAPEGQPKYDIADYIQSQNMPF